MEINKNEQPVGKRLVITSDGEPISSGEPVYIESSGPIDAEYLTKVKINNNPIKVPAQGVKINLSSGIGITLKDLQDFENEVGEKYRSTPSKQLLIVPEYEIGETVQINGIDHVCTGYVIGDVLEYKFKPV